MRIRALGVIPLLLILPILVAQTPAPVPGGDPSKIADLAEEVRSGCDAELKSHCKGVTPGEGRQLACLYAHEDKLSNRCEYALYDASAELQRRVNSLAYVASECDDDMEKHCADVQPGEGKLMQCLKKHESELSDRCERAMKDVHRE
jgi:hypothetical protein